MKQTALDIFFSKLGMHEQWVMQHDFEQAKAMEKEQIIDAFGVGCQVEATRLIGYHEMSEQYYNETYGGNK